MRRESGGWGSWGVLAWVVALAMWGLGCGQGEDSSPDTLPEVSEPLPTESLSPLPLPSEQAPVSPVAPPPASEQSGPPALAPWGIQQGGLQDDAGRGVAADGAGHVAWVWISTLREDEGREPVDGQRRALTLSRYTAEGVHEWTREFPRVRISEPRVGASANGAVYLGGNAFLSPVDFGLGEAQDGFLVRFSGAGEPVWQQRVGQKVHGLAVEAGGEVLVSGEEWAEGTPLPLLTRYGADGSVRWTRQLDGAGKETEVGAVALADSGRAVLTARLDGELALDDQRFGTVGEPSLAVFVFDPNGSLSWGKVLGTGGGIITGVAVREDGSLVVSGEAQGALSWGGTTLPEGGPFLLTMDAQGHEGWLRRPGCEALGLVPSLAVEDTGAVVTACGNTLSFYSSRGAVQGERALQPESCTSGVCTLTSTALAPLLGGAVAVTGHQRDGVDTGGWNQEAFLRVVRGVLP